MTPINYKNLVDAKPTLYKTIVNQLDQSIDLVEHPTRGDEYPVIAIYHKEKIAVVTDFYDCGDFYEDSDYNPICLNGEIGCAYEFDL